jgi:hypothetical protein
MTEEVACSTRLRFGVIRSITFAGAALVAATEMLGAMESIRRLPLAMFWIVIGGCGAAVVISRWRRLPGRWPQLDAVAVLCWLACFVIVAITGATAVLSPPNSADAMAYHMPRVVYWAEQSSVRFFPTPYLNQIMLQPFAEYVMLHLYVLSGGDRLINLVQWSASVVSILAVTLVAAQMGTSARGQAIAALFAASLPAGILASSGAKNDYVLAMWMIIAVSFAIRFASTSAMVDALYLGAAIGLALFTKATAYLFLPWLIAAVLVTRWRPNSKRAGVAAVAAIVCGLAINAPQYLRNYSLSGSILGFDSAQANGFFRWRNETFGWRQTVSNIVRNTSEQLGARSDWWNAGVYRATLSIHQFLGIDPDDPATTWRWSKFEAPKNANHEANAPNRWHLGVLAAIAFVLAWRAVRGRDRERALYMAALFLGFLSFCVYLKWQPFLGRLFVPLFVAAAPMAGVIGEIRPRAAAFVVQMSLCLVLLDNARRPAMQNWVRPLQGPLSVLRVPRDEQYFADMSQWNNRQSYMRSADLIERSVCDVIGIDINNLQVEYPLMALVRERKPQAWFVHTGVANPSRRYQPPVATPPCMVACLDCLGDAVRLEQYSQFQRTAVFGRFVVFER